MKKSSATDFFRQISLLEKNAVVTVIDVEESIQWWPVSSGPLGLVFVCGA